MKKTIGLDIGGTKITGAVLSGNKIIKELTVATAGNLPGFKSSLENLVKSLSAGENIRKLGIGIAGLVEPNKCTVVRSPNIPYLKNLNFKTLFARHQVRVDNDASCFARAELMLGQGRGRRNFVAVILGTGIGGGIVINGRLYRGLHNFGGEIGSMVMGSGSFESLYQKSRGKGDYKKMGDIIGQGFADLYNIFDPECLIVGGGVGLHRFGDFMPYAKKKMAALTLADYYALKPKIFRSKLKNAGVLGAALLF